MTPNLAKLFEQAKTNCHAGWKAHNKLGWIWDRHGEALVKALEGILPVIRKHHPSLLQEEFRLVMSAADLLAAMERDAKEGL